jgi:predicted phage baseplate assembly protein
MPLTVPTLDDRRYQDLLDEALARIPVHNPEWTNFNASDPGVTLIEVFAFLTESLLYRCNQIPERNRRKFLSLLGIPLQPAASARGMVTFANDRGPAETIVLASGIEVRAGQVPFRTDQGLDLLPIEARAFVKRAIDDPPEAVREYYRQLYASFRGQPPTADVRLYETTPFPAASTGVSPIEAVDGAVWIALLLREGDRTDEETRRVVRDQMGGRTLSLGVIPIVSDATRHLAPVGVAANTTSPALRFQIPRIPPGGALPVRAADRVPQYRDLDPQTTVDPFAEPAIVQLTLPPADELVLWNNVDPLESGAGAFPPAIEDTNLGDRVITWLRLQSTPALPSQLKWIGVNAALATQRAGVAGEVLPDGTGEPDQTCTLARRPIVARSVRLQVTANSATREWAEIDDLLNAGPEVRVQDPRDPPGTPPPSGGAPEVFVVDLESGEIRFGDGAHGARPPIGATLRADYDYSVGRAGNVGPGAINSGTALPAGIQVTNPDRTWGGADAEAAADGEKQIARHLQHRDRLVTASDFEAIALRTPGVAIGRVEVIPAFSPELPQNDPGDAPGAVTVMVIPESDPLQPDAPRPDRFFLNAICTYLDARRLVATELFVRGPVYKPIWVSAGIAVVAGMSVAEVRQAVRGALLEFLSPLPPAGTQSLDDPATMVRMPRWAESRRGWPLRKAVIALELLAVANRVEGVLLVNDLLVADGSGAPQTQIPMNGLELPRVLGISVAVGDPVDLDQVRGQSLGAAPGVLVPVPVIPEAC